MEMLLTNVSGKVRRATLHGREYLVAPMTMLRQGVLKGSKGRLFYPQDEISREPWAWNHMPIVVGHPMQDGQPITARHPIILEERGIGMVFQANTEMGPLDAEAWFDEERTKRIQPSILSDLQAGRAIEVSTGLFTVDEKAPLHANHNGEPYEFTARYYRPDHLAILIDEKGACPREKGCGVLVNSAVTQTGVHDVKREEIINWLVVNCDCWKGANDKEVLNTMTEDKLKKLKANAEKAAQQEAVVNAARKGYETIYGEEQTKKLTTNSLVEFVTNQMAAEVVEEEEPDEEVVPPPVTPPVVAKKVKGGKKGAPPPPAANTAPEPETPVVTTPVVDVRPTKPRDMKSWLKDAPPEALAVWNHAVEVEKREKNLIIERLKDVAENTTDPARQALILNRLSDQSLSVNQLNELYVLVRPMIGSESRSEPEPSYLGAATLPTTNLYRSDDKEDLLPLPTLNFDEDENGQPRKKYRYV